MQVCPAELNYAQYLAEFNRPRALKTAYIDDTRKLTYGELAELSGRFAGLLKNLDIRREERILLVMHDTVDWPVVFLGGLHAGVVPVAVNTLLTADDYAYMLEHSRAQAVFTSPGLLETVQSALEKSRHEVRKVVVAGASAGELPANVEHFDTLMQQAQ
ncbi:MAG TPA: benzoate-CoA ligase family protein, partial [Pusillimonas sp.]|nr:benzoate-CoA ligase family protein [Pusillimonas sp.]